MEMSSISSSISSAILPFCSDRCSDLLKVCGLFVKLRLQKIIFFSIFLQKSKHLQVLNQFLNHYLSQFNSLYDRKSLTLSFGSHPHNHHLQETSNVTFNLKKIIISTWKIYWLFSKCILYFYVHGYKQNYFNYINIHLLKIHNLLIFTYKHWKIYNTVYKSLNHVYGILLEQW